MIALKERQRPTYFPSPSGGGQERERHLHRMNAMLYESPLLTSPRGRGIGFEDLFQRERDTFEEPLPEGEGMINKRLAKL